MQASGVTVARRIQASAGYALTIVLFGLIASAYRAGARALARFAAAQHQARLRRELQGLSDHYLRDIGLRRDQIDGMFR
ncbi:MAG TPA: DUF1127 domain-containing protein [Burkholderiales bacterium]|jgi:uncharacterized protein YjiS (DUF1127 family)|nr:DUF1127 domain-containing protein [Burkholderiales bacterium]